MSIELPEDAKNLPGWNFFIILDDKSILSLEEFLNRLDDHEFMKLIKGYSKGIDNRIKRIQKRLRELEKERC